MGPRQDGRSEEGSAAVVTTFAVLMALAAFLMAVNLVVDQYGQGVLRTAVDEAARSGSLQGAPGGAQSACVAKEAEVMSGLLSGPFAAHVHLGCSVEAGEVVATADGSLPGWLPPVPAVRVHVLGTSVLENDPTPSSP